MLAGKSPGSEVAGIIDGWRIFGGELMNSATDLVVLGDLNLDILAPNNLSFAFTELKEHGRIEQADLKLAPGGSGLNFASHAHIAGYQVLLLGAVGDDPAAKHLLAWLIEQGIDTRGVRTAVGDITGICFIARDANGIRLLVNRSPNANLALSVDDVDRYAEDIKSCRILFISGYCIAEPASARYQAALHAMSLAKRPVTATDTRVGQGGADPQAVIGSFDASTAPHVPAKLASEARAPVVVLDLVPHDLFRILSPSALRACTQHVDLIISAVSTMRRFLGLGHPGELVNRKLAEQTLDAAKPHHDRLVLHFGEATDLDEVLLWDGSRGCCEYRKTGHDAVKDKRGDGDRLAIRWLREFFGLV